MVDDKHFAQAFKDLSAEHISDKVDLWERIEREITQERKFWMRKLSWRGWLLVSIMMFLTMATVVIAVERILDGDADPGLDAVEEAGLIIPMDMSQTNGNVSITIDYVYADVNRISIGYHYSMDAIVRTSYGHSFSVTLDDDLGTQFTGIYGEQMGQGGGGGGGGGGDESMPTPEPRTVTIAQGEIANFDASQINGSPDELNLIARFDYQVDSDMEGESYADSLTFEFTVPFNPGMTMSDTLTAESNDVTFTLTNLLVAPSMTKAQICMDGLNWSDYAMLDVHISVDGESVYDNTIRYNAGVVPILDENFPENCRIYVITDALDGYSGEWTFTINGLVSVESPDVDVLAAALIERGIPAEVHEQNGERLLGIGSSAENPLPENFSEIMQEVDGALRDRFEGVWSFIFTMP